MRRHQSIRGGAWYMDDRKKNVDKQEELFPIGVLAALILGTLGGVVIIKLFGGKRPWRRR